MCDQCTGRPRSTPVSPNTNPSSRPAPSNAPAVTPPIRALTFRIAAGTHSLKPSPHVSRWSSTHARNSSGVASGRTTTSGGVGRCASVRPAVSAARLRSLMCTDFVGGPAAGAGSCPVVCGRLVCAGPYTVRKANAQVKNLVTNPHGLAPARFLSDPRPGHGNDPAKGARGDAWAPFSLLVAWLAKEQQ